MSKATSAKPRIFLAVGSTNPVKLRAVENAAAQLKPNLIIKGFSVPSGIDEQPRTDVETRQGARNRARRALKQLLREEKHTATSQFLGIGLEGGIFAKGKELWATVWAVVVDTEGNEYLANGARMPIGEPLAQLLRDGGEMGPVMSQLTGEDNVKHKQGMIGIVTKNFTDRTAEYQAIAQLAIGQWYGRDWSAVLKQ